MLKNFLDNMATQRPAKGLTESLLYEKNKNKITKNTQLLDKVLNGVTFAVASRPEEFPLVDKHGTRSAKTEETPELPSLTIFFKEFEDDIVLIDIQLTPGEVSH